MDNFDLKKYLYNKSILTEGLDLKASPVKEEEEMSSKITKKALKEKIRGAIMDTLSEEDTMDEKTQYADPSQHDGRDDNFNAPKALKYATAGALAVSGIKRYGQKMLEKFFNALPEELAQELNDIIQYAVDNGILDAVKAGLFEKEDVKEGFLKKLKYASIGALGALGIKKYGQQLLGHLFNALPEDMAQKLNDIIQYMVDNGAIEGIKGLFEEEGEDDLDAALDAAEDEVGDEAPADDAPAEEPAGPELSDEAGLSDEETDIQSNLKKAYDNAVSIGDEKLANQIANTITFFTRAHVVPRKD